LAGNARDGKFREWLAEKLPIMVDNAIHRRLAEVTG
jgi:hypothetical protein